MYKAARLLGKIRLLVYIVTLAFMVQVFIDMATDVTTGGIDEAFFYKGTSFVWATLFLIAAKGMYDLGDAVKDIAKDVKKLKKKGYEVNQMNAPIYSETISVNEEDLKELSLIEKILNRKEKKELPN